MSRLSKCSGCGGESFIDGKLYGMNKLSFAPDQARFLTLETSKISVKARMCEECGAVDMIGDVEKLRRLAKLETGPEDARTDYEGD